MLLVYPYSLSLNIKEENFFFGWHAGVNSKEDKDACFAWSPNGWTDHELAMDYLIDHFVPLAMEISDTRFPLFLILDRHSSHMTWQFLSYCLDNNIRVLCLPPHSTHLLQPLDMGVFFGSSKGICKGGGFLCSKCSGCY